ncbi:acyltransferase [Paracoccus liaowanqingii]|uniref:Acyltransferase n=1 Tax=Paracoccus liaowanqingii TaxID=2560053 RepID=A0A4Z1CEF1_9RHOB|nr:acyltransferase family protein [Paracoccus liaowanqingii]TGN51267.1 acyltransferase [Paracoccus liaowanqingii]
MSGPLADRHAGYRPEIDGLRAVAVGGVVLYHFDLPGLPGGFTGVDVFFVLSGYLIGAILWREFTATGRIDPVRFFLRRFRRLAPAWSVVALAVFAAGYLILLPHDLRELGKSLIAASLFMANIQFWRQAGYFDSSSAEKPLLHMWSLSLEEQFYIVLPLVLLICIRRPRLALVLLGGGAALSLALSVGITARDQTAAFFLFPFRAWELLSGVLLAIWAQDRPGPRRGWMGSAAGLALVVAGMMVIQPGAGFPGVWALIPVLGTLLLIRHGQAANPVNRLLSWGPMRGLGLISYSLYLWHWPIRSLSDFALGPGRGLLGNIGLIGLSVLLAYATWRWVEQPTRDAARLPSRRMIAGVALSSVLLLALGGWSYTRDGLPERWSPTVLTHADAAQDFIQDWSRCYTPQTGPFAGIQTCPIGPEGQPQMLAWGDSHLRAIKEGLDRAAHEAGTPGLLIWRAGCPPMFGVEKRESAATRVQDIACTHANARIEAALRDNPFPDVLLVGRWSYYATGSGVGADAHNRIEVLPAWPTAVDTTLQALTAMGSRVHVLRQAPEIPDYGSLPVARALARNEAVPQDRFQVALPDALSREAAGLAPFVAGPSRIELIDPWPLHCDANTCSVLRNGRTVYFDNNHLTNQGALQMRHLFDPLLTLRNRS